MDAIMPLRGPTLQAIPQRDHQVSQNPPADQAVEVALSIEEIRERAYDLWDRNHRPDGYELEFWLMAERELRAERKARSDQAGPKAPA